MRGKVIVANSEIVPPVGVYIVAGCGADFFINICLTLLAYVAALYLSLSLHCLC